MAQTFSTVDRSRDPAAQARRPLLGRETELALLRERLSAAAAGHGSVVLIAGEPGAGKTRLLDALAGEAAAAGVIVLRGEASDATGMPPYLPFIEALGRYILTTAPDRLLQQFGPVASVLATILPEVTERLGPS